MLQISISSELTAEHPGFMAECAGRGHAVEVFEASENIENIEQAKMPGGEDRQERDSLTAAEGHG